MRSPWVAAEEAAEGQPRAFQSSVHSNRLDPVVAARRIVPADSMPPARQPQPWGNGQLVEADQFGK